MIPNLKAVGLAVVTVLAMSAVIASTSSAAVQYTCSSYPCTVTGSNVSGNETFTTPGGTVQCESHFEATLKDASSALIVTPTFQTEKCPAFGFLNGAIHTNGCKLRFTPSGKLGEGHYSHKWDILCESGKQIVITAATCEVAFVPQTGLSSVTTTNSGGSVTVTPNVENLTMNVIKDGLGCPFSGTGHKLGSYHGHFTLSNTWGAGTFSVSGS
jgi:hypothetical protein